MDLCSAAHSMSSSDGQICARACGSRVAKQFARNQERGGRKGRLPNCEDTLSLVRINLGAVLSGDEKAISENSVAVKPKHAIAQAAMHAPSSVVFCVLSLGILWWWSQ